MKTKLLWAAVVALAAALLGQTLNLRVTEGHLKDQKAETARVQGQLDGERLLSSFAAATAEVRYEASEKARQAAVEAGKANRTAATTYLALPAPAPELRCEAAQELIEQARKEAR